jgi:hypothetical protein
VRQTIHDDLGWSDREAAELLSRFHRYCCRLANGSGRISRPLNASRSKAQWWDSTPPGPMHVQSGEVRAPIGIAGHDLAVDHRRLGRQLPQQLCDGREAFREVVPI